MNELKKAHESLLSKYGDTKVSNIIDAYIFFSGVRKGIVEAKDKREGFKKAKQGLEKIEKDLNKIVPFVSEDKNTKNTILGIAGTYDHFTEQLDSADKLSKIFGKDHDGPKKLYLVLLSKILKNDNGSANLNTIREVILHQQKVSLYGVNESFFDIYETEDDSHIENQKDKLGKLIKRSESADWYKNLLS